MHLGDSTIKVPLVSCGDQFRGAFAHVPNSQSCRYCLSKDGGCCTAQDAEAQQSQEDQIQHCIEDRGEGQKFQRRLCIAHALQPRGQGVVTEGKGSTQEGDPQIKGKIRSKMRETSMRRMMQQMPDADVVITNPTHFACAIKYDKEKAAAPVLIAKGADYLAQKIKEVAKEYSIPIVENKPLARMLYYNVDLDSEIPRELYQMTAEVLAYVYKLKNDGAA